MTRTSESGAARRVRTTVAALVAIGIALASQGRAAQPQDEARRRNNLGVGLMDAGTKDPKYFAEAVREFDAALKMAPDYQLARLNLGVALYYAGQTDSAARTLENSVRDQPGNLTARFVLGLLREYAGQYEAAISHFRSVADRDATDADAWYHLAYCLSRVDRHADAVEGFRRAAALVPYQRRVRYGLFMALTRAGRQAEAQAELEAFRSLGASQIRVVEGPKNTLEYLKQGRHAEATADSRQPAPPVRAAVYVDVGRELGLGSARTMAARPVDAVLRGEPRPSAFFSSPARRAEIGAATSVAAAFVDVNNDGALDVYAVVSGVQKLFAQDTSGRFIAARTLPVSTGVLAAAWGDLNNDGWSDLVAAEPGRLLVATNRRGRLDSAAPTTIRLPPRYRAAGLALSDVDHDGDLDIVVAGGVDLARARGNGPLRFPQDFESRPTLLMRNNSDGTFTEVGREAGIAGVGASALRIWFGDVDDDRAVDAVLVGADGTQTVLLNHKDGTFVRSASVQVPARDPVGLDEARAYGDYNRDGAIDELIVGASGVRLRRNDARPQHWLTVRPSGYAVPGKVKSNRLGIGARVEVRSSGFWERREVRAGNGVGGTDAAEATFDLGSQTELDFVRAVFPSGVRRTVTNVSGDRAMTVEEPLLDVNSCPTLFTWDGTRFAFVTDTLGAGVLGELVAPGEYWQPDPDEWVRLDEGKLVPRPDGSLSIRFTNPLEEVTYLDGVRLVAVDHPAATEAYTDERMLGNHDHRAIGLFAVTERRPLAKALDHHAHDVGRALAAADRKYFDHFAARPFKGFAGRWALTLDLGAIPTASRPVLGIEGWSYWNSSASIVAATQARERLWGPVLEVRDRAGRWRLATDDLGLLAGLPRVMLVDLRQYLRPGEHVIRISSNRTLYYDRMWVGTAVEVRGLEDATRSPSLVTTEVPLKSADLRWLGYPRRLLPDGKLPELFDYQEIEQTADWGTHAGLLTRYGDVRDLLRDPDDKMAVMEHGEEVALEFDGSRLPRPPAGWRRTFFFYANGYEKGYEIATARGETVDPLPFHGMGTFPFDAGIERLDADYVQYRLEWNTRPAFLRTSPEAQPRREVSVP